MRAVRFLRSSSLSTVLKFEHSRRRPNRAVRNRERWGREGGWEGGGSDVVARQRRLELGWRALCNRGRVTGRFGLQGVDDQRFATQLDFAACRCHKGEPLGCRLLSAVGWDCTAPEVLAVSGSVPVMGCDAARLVTRNWGTRVGSRMTDEDGRTSWHESRASASLSPPGMRNERKGAQSRMCGDMRSGLMPTRPRAQGAGPPYPPSQASGRHVGGQCQQALPQTLRTVCKAEGTGLCTRRP